MNGNKTTLKASTPTKDKIPYAIHIPHINSFLPTKQESHNHSHVNHAINETKKENKRNTISEIVCNCKNSKCLKLYCPCFASECACSEDCKCKDCKNIEQSSERINAVKRTKFVHKHAFQAKTEVKTSTTSMTISTQHVQGCKCTKSNCLKKYCECFNMGIACGAHCKCENCYNTVSASELVQSQEIHNDMFANMDFSSEKLFSFDT